MTPSQFFVGVLKAMGLPATQANVNWLLAWSQKEGTAARFNPLATTLQTRGSTPLPGNSAGVQEYPNAATGIAATARTLRAYSGIVAQLKSGDAIAYSFNNPAALVQEYGTWDLGPKGYASNPAAGFAYYQSIKVLAQGGAHGSLSAADAGSYDLNNLAHDVGSPLTGWVGQLAKWAGDKAAYASLYAGLVLFAIVLALIGLLGLLGVHPSAIARTSMKDAAVAAA